MKQPNLLKSIEELLCPVVEGLGFELVDVQLATERGRRILRILADRPGGITLGECTGLSREISPHLEVADIIPGAYVLEVSSPGIQRPLKRPADFRRFSGQQVLVKTTEAIDGQRNFRGINQGLDERGEQLLIDDPETKRTHRIPLSLLQRARLDPDIRI